MENQNKNNEINKTPSKMSRIAWPKAKYGLIIAILIIFFGNLFYYRDFFLSLFK